jgi:hypothetical protein
VQVEVNLPPGAVVRRVRTPLRAWVSARFSMVVEHGYVSLQVKPMAI